MAYSLKDLLHYNKGILVKGKLQSTKITSKDLSPLNARILVRGNIITCKL